ncbi:MAG: hypothetical protein MJZ64_01980 [Paludibacteraceae bacterium]|nr:hypothetical protein [Paludibacteraceae bacterium]
METDRKAIDLNIGDIVRVKNGHPCVIINNVVSKDGRIEGVPLTHDSVGKGDIKNIPLQKDFFDEEDENGNRYEFQWEDNGNGRVTSMMCKVFEKDVKNLKIDSGRIGHVNEKGISFLKENINEKVIWDLFITKR